MVKDNRVRVHEREYKLIKELSEKEGISQADAVHRLIGANYVVEGGKVEEVANGGFGSKLFWGAVATAGAMVAKELLKGDDKGSCEVAEDENSKN